VVLVAALVVEVLVVAVLVEVGKFKQYYFFYYVVANQFDA
jgi:hypothetical protein